MLATLLGMATPALAQGSSEVPEQDEVPAGVLEDTCLDTSEEQEAAADQYTESPEPPSRSP